MTIKTQYGYVNVTLRPTVFNGFTVYANGTVFFDVSFPTATQQGTYTFQTKSYGNGTMRLRFFGPIPQSVTHAAATSSYDSSASWQQITYTANQNSQLILIYAPVIVFGVALSSGLFQLIMAATGIMYGSMFIGLALRYFEKENFPFTDPRVIIISGAVGTLGFLFMLIVGANLVRPACPVGYTCTG